MPFANQKGNVIAYVIIAMTTIAALGVGAMYMTSSAALGELGANNLNRAYFLALAGKDYALIKNLGDTSSYPSGRRDFTLSNGDLFGLAIGGNNITSTGIVNIGTPFEARRAISITKTGFSSQPDISFTKDIAAFESGKKQTQSGFITVDQSTSQIQLGQYQASQFGSVWYGGNTSAANCQDGKCNFGTGFRVYFVFKLERYSTDIPHGFTFAVFNGNTNSLTSTGGDSGMPELLAYGGNSRYYDGTNWTYLDPNTDVSKKGIQAPKMAIEFDGRQNCCDTSPCDLGNCKTDFCNYAGYANSNSRFDGSSTHMAYVFWGNNSTTCSNKGYSLTYDDNRHGAGDTSDPINSVSTDSSDTNDYFTGIMETPAWDSAWLFTSSVPAYAFRMEVTRGDNTNKHFYSINSWIKQCTTSDCSDVITNYPGYDNTKIAYSPQTPDIPVLSRTIELDQTFHDYFNTFYFGWTLASGSASRENVTLSNFKMYFIKEAVGCGGYAVWNNAGTAYFSINGAGCVANNNAFIGNIGASGSIRGYTDALCSPPSTGITFAQAATADTNKNCEVYFNGTDK